jgi:hypothetical protein
VKELSGNPACVTGATAENESAEPSESKVYSAVQHTSARRRPEITRFKGVDEISPMEFSQFIGKQTRLSKVEFPPRAESAPIFNFQSLIQNNKWCCCWAKGRMARRDEKEYPLRVFDRGATKPAGLLLGNPSGAGLLAVGSVGSVVTARCGDVYPRRLVHIRNSKPQHRS